MRIQIGLAVGQEKVDESPLAVTPRTVGDNERMQVECFGDYMEGEPVLTKFIKLLRWDYKQALDSLRVQRKLTANQKQMYRGFYQELLTKPDELFASSLEEAREMYDALIESEQP